MRRRSEAFGEVANEEKLSHAEMRKRTRRLLMYVDLSGIHCMALEMAQVTEFQ